MMGSCVVPLSADVCRSNKCAISSKPAIVWRCVARGRKRVSQDPWGTERIRRGQFILLAGSWECSYSECSQWSADGQKGLTVAIQDQSESLA